MSLQQPLYGGHGATHDFARGDDLMESIQQLSPQMSPMPIGAIHPSHVNVQQF